MRPSHVLRAWQQRGAHVTPTWRAIQPRCLYMCIGRGGLRSRGFPYNEDPDKVPPPPPPCFGKHHTITAALKQSGGSPSTVSSLPGGDWIPGQRP